MSGDDERDAIPDGPAPTAGPLVLPPFVAGVALDRYRALACRAFWPPPAPLPRRAPGSAALAAGRGRGGAEGGGRM